MKTTELNNNNCKESNFGKCDCGIDYKETKRTDIPFDIDGDVMYTDIIIKHCPQCGNIEEITEY